MRIALLSDCYLPRLGGIEVQVHDLAHHLAALGHEVEVVTATPGNTRERTTEREQPRPGSAAAAHSGSGSGSGSGSVTVHRLPLSVPGAPPINPFVKDEVRELLDRGRFDVAHGHMGVVSPFATDMIGVALDAGLPTAATWHCVIDHSAPLFRALGHARRWGERGAALSAVSAMAADRVASIAGSAPVEVLGNGIDVDVWRPPRDLERPDDGVIRVVSAMRFVRRKRPGAIVDVIARARAALTTSAPGVRIEVSLVGDGPQRRLLQTRLDRQGIDGVHLTGRVSRDELRALHWASDIYLTTARLEAFGIAPLEARTAGLAVVGLLGTGIEDFVHDGTNGLLRASDDELASAVAELAAHPERLRAIREHNLTTPPVQSWPNTVDATLAEYARARRQRGRT